MSYDEQPMSLEYREVSILQTYGGFALAVVASKCKKE